MRARLVLSLSVICGVSGGVLANDPAEKSRAVRFTYAASVREIPKDAREVRFWIPFPSQSDVQRISNIVVTSDTPTSVDRDPEYGNQVLSLSVANPTGRPVSVQLQFDVVRRELTSGVNADKTARSKPPAIGRIDERWLEPDKLVPTDGKILELALDVTRGHTGRLAQARAIYDHTVATLKYDKTGTGWGRGDIHYACDVKKGNCTDFHAVFIGLCRARRIPARFEIGFSLPSDKPAGEIAGYHCWAECYVEGHGWIPVDCSEAQKHPERREYFFGTLDEHRIGFSGGRDIELAPRQEGDRLNFFIYPYAEVDGQPYEKIERKFRYENLAAN